MAITCRGAAWGRGWEGRGGRCWLRLTPGKAARPGQQLHKNGAGRARRAAAAPLSPAAQRTSCPAWTMRRARNWPKVPKPTMPILSLAGRRRQGRERSRDQLGAHKARMPAPPSASCGSGSSRAVADCIPGCCPAALQLVSRQQARRCHPASRTCSAASAAGEAAPRGRKKRRRLAPAPARLQAGMQGGAVGTEAASCAQGAWPRGAAGATTWLWRQSVNRPPALRLSAEPRCRRSCCESAGRLKGSCHPAGLQAAATCPAELAHRRWLPAGAAGGKSMQQEADMVPGAAPPGCAQM